MAGFEPRTSDIACDRSTNWATTAAHLQLCYFKKWANPGSFSLIFVYSNTQYKFYNKYVCENVHPVYGTGIRIHNLWNMSLLR